MFFNYDLFEIVAVAFVVSGLLTFSIYKSSPIMNESLVNTNSLSNLDSNIQLDNLPIHNYVDASAQTVNTYVNTGMQTSPRMWLESVRNWITELLSIRSSELQGVTPTVVRVVNLINNLDNTQLVPQNSMNNVILNESENLLLEYAQSQTNFDIGSRAEYFNVISPQVDVTLENIMVNETQYLFAVIKDVILTLDPNIFNCFF